MKKIQTSFLVPITEDKDVGNGELHPNIRWERLQNDLYVKFEGYNIAPGLYPGVYPDLDTGGKVSDLSRKYFVAVKKEELDRLRTFLEEIVGPLFRQKCIYFEVKGDVEFIKSNLSNLGIIL